MFADPGPLDFVSLAHRTLEFWERARVFARLVERNRGGPPFSFLDGPITANNPMGVHHARGRTAKDVIQRYRAMCGFDQRFQNGFDCQGLWVEVEVEKALGLDGKREIEAMGLEAFARACRERVLRFAHLQTEQSKRLGQWMDWPRSYYTMSDDNITAIWHFLAACHRRGWITTGHRVMPWCVRCGTAISQHEMLDSHAEVTHRSVVVALPVTGREGTALLAWTTTPWTLPANVALAVHPEADYEAVAVDDGLAWVAAAARPHLPGLGEVRHRMKGADLVGWRYTGPFDDLPGQRGVDHHVVAWDEVTAHEGTGIVHIAPGCGQEDFDLGRRHGLAVVAAIDGDGRYLPGFGRLTGLRLSEATGEVVESLRGRGLLHGEAPYRHRYPSCWRCGHELVFRLVDEWFIRADELRPLALAANATVTWRPEHMGLRMQDWLTHMGDWCISRKRYWGLPLPFYPCAACGHLTVVGSGAELRTLAVDPAAAEALPELHRPWIDAVVIRCPACRAEVPRVPEVGDCWLDAGIVPFSTLGHGKDPAAWARWFPADLVVEGTAQIRGWFYALLVMAVTLEGRAPYRTVMAHERVLDGEGREMHKSRGNAVWLDEALAQMGPDVVRYLFASAPLAEPVRFSPAAGREVTRRFLTLWNVYTLFVTYANVDGPSLPPDAAAPETPGGLEAWILARLDTTVAEVRAALDDYQLRRAVRAIEVFVQDDLSSWYVRRRRRLFWKGEMTPAKAEAYRTLFHVLVRVCQLLAPVAPFVADHMYRGLLGEGDGDSPRSVHLAEFPRPDPTRADPELAAGVAVVRRVVSAGLAVRNAAGLKVRQPLATALVLTSPDQERWLRQFEADLLDELNVEALETGPLAAGPVEPGPGSFRVVREKDLVVALDTALTPALRRKGLARQLAHHVQLVRKAEGLRVDERIRLAVSVDGERRAAIEEHREYVRAETLALELRLGTIPEGFAVREVRLDGGRAAIGLARASVHVPGLE